MTLVRSLCAAVEASVARKPVSLPLGAGILWSAFCELSLSRSMGPVGPNPITFAEIEAWARLMRVPLEPHHVRILLAMDRTWLEELRKDPTPPPLSAAAFDGIAG